MSSSHTATLVRVVASGDLHTIRFKTGSVEFELTSSAPEVAKARELLADAITAAFSNPPDEDAAGSEPGDVSGDSTTKKTRKRRSSRRSNTSAVSGGSDARNATRDKLLGASLEGFPPVGDKPASLLAGYALLSWAHKKLDIDGLTAQEIQAFYNGKWRLKRSYQAFSQALAKRVRTGDVDVQGSNPQVFRLMSSGETELAGMLKKANERSKQ